MVLRTKSAPPQPSETALTETAHEVINRFRSLIEKRLRNLVLRAFNADLVFTMDVLKVS